MTAIAERATYINEQAIFDCLSRTVQPESARARDLFAKAKEMQGLTFDEVATLIALQDPELTAELFAAARAVKEEIYGSRLVMFAPLYISNRCTNECEYCAYRASNRELHRITLTQQQIAAEIKVIVEQGHKRILMVAGEAYPNSNSLDYVFEAIKTIYATRSGNGEIRRVNVNIAPLHVDDFRKLKACGIGTYQCFQETYHRDTYAKVHPRGRKSDYDWRATVMDRAMQAGIDDVGIGPLFGIYDWRFEVLAMLQHIHHLEERFGCGPHTISVPRLERAAGTDFTATTPWKVSDADFLKLIAILRLTVPYTGMIMSTRESAEVRRQSFQIGISQTSAGSRTDPGGYELAQGDFNSSQFAVGDTRPVDEVVREIAEMGFTPSFCTACYRLGRTGSDFMDIAKPGSIKYHCEPNALSTFTEYLEDYASPETKAVGEQHMLTHIAQMDARQQRIARPMIAAVRSGKRDVYV
ncbi:MAG TPA: [FeFe] hydrogenase H-cluster radical SAM maturase HydG [Acidobacteriaceae bacterium]|jgi:2-iminoacetate synthase|nr:[FeFe] hydrogenase H-cluster radical SAM maturase HydG [Acidobacteriaceae bacterium]